MKKSIFVLATLFVATFANAQITLEHTLSKDEGHVLFPYVVGNSYYSIYMLGTSNVSAPRSNARKYLHNDQVRIDSNERTYTTDGRLIH